MEEGKKGGTKEETVEGGRERERGKRKGWR